MKKLITLLLPSLAMPLAFNAGYAQDAAPTWTPTEIYACSFNGDADMNDLNAVIDTMNEWMDDNATNDYTAIVMTPNFSSAAVTFDFLWVGAWTGGAGLAGLDQWFSEAADIQGDFAEVASCPSHQGFAMTNVTEFGGPAAADGIVPVAFSNCTVSEGRIGPEAGAGLRQWAAYLAENGSDAGHWIMRPGPGGAPDDSYSFKWVSAYSSYASLGQYFELFYNDGGAQMYDQLTSRVVSCDSPRVYNSRIVRAVAEEE